MKTLHVLGRDHFDPSETWLMVTMGRFHKKSWKIWGWSSWNSVDVTNLRSYWVDSQNFERRSCVESQLPTFTGTGLLSNPLNPRSGAWAYPWRFTLRQRPVEHIWTLPSPWRFSWFRSCNGDGDGDGFNPHNSFWNHNISGKDLRLRKLGLTSLI